MTHTFKEFITENFGNLSILGPAVAKALIYNAGFMGQNSIVHRIDHPTVDNINRDINKITKDYDRDSDKIYLCILPPDQNFRIYSRWIQDKKWDAVAGKIGHWGHQGKYALDGKDIHIDGTMQVFLVYQDKERLNTQLQRSSTSWRDSTDKTFDASVVKVLFRSKSERVAEKLKKYYHAQLENVITIDHNGMIKINSDHFLKSFLAPAYISFNGESGRVKSATVKAYLNWLKAVDTKFR